MTNVINLAVLILLAFTFTVSTALAASLKTGLYAANHGEMSLSITLNAGGSGFFEGETQNSLEWKQAGSELILKIYGEEGSAEFGTYNATVLSQDSFDLGGLKYIYTAQAQESDFEFITDEWEVIGIYKNESGDSVTYVYPAEGDGVLNARELSWSNPNKVGITPPDTDYMMTFSGRTERGEYCTECYVEPDYGDVFPENRYGFYLNDYGDIVFKSALPSSPYFIKIADLYTDAGTEGPLSGVFCGTKEDEEYLYIGIKATPTSEEVWFFDGVQADNYPPKGTPVEYSVQKYNIFEPKTLTFWIKSSIVDIQPKQ